MSDPIVVTSQYLEGLMAKHDSELARSPGATGWCDTGSYSTAAMNAIPVLVQEVEHQEAEIERVNKELRLAQTMLRMKNIADCEDALARSKKSLPEDSQIINWIEEFITTGCLTTAFEMDGGIHVTFATVGDETESAMREQDNFRTAMLRVMEGKAEPVDGQRMPSFEQQMANLQKELVDSRNETTQAKRDNASLQEFSNEAVYARDSYFAELQKAEAEIRRLREALEKELCSDCPRVGYPTDETRCKDCPRRPDGALSPDPDKQKSGDSPADAVK